MRTLRIFRGHKEYSVSQAKVKESGGTLKLATFAVSLIFVLTSCFSSSKGKTPDAKPKSVAAKSKLVSAAASSSVKAARFIFRVDDPNGSFDDPTATYPTGIDATPATATDPRGLRAQRVFDTTNTALGTYGGSGWPSWIDYLEVGLSGATNSEATDTDCARFATAVDAAVQCDFGGGNVDCGAPQFLYRVSEWDCLDASETIATGTGDGTDGVFVRLALDRSGLNSTDNLLMVLEYSAATLNAGSTDPMNCFDTGTDTFDPTNSTCSEMSWQIFLKSSVTDAPQPFLLLVPPFLANYDNARSRSGNGVMSRQIMIPLASNSDATVIDISRITANDGTINVAPCAANSAMCGGMVFYTMTLFRI